MARFLLWSLLPFSLLRVNDALAQSCYATTWQNGMPVYNTIGASGTTVEYCQALACQIWPTIQGCPGTVPVCQTETQTQVLTCPVNYSGQITQTRTKVCPSGTWTDWQTVQNACTPNPPSCQVTTESQTLQCQTGYTGSITQTRSSTCPNPYGQPVLGAWVTTSDSCKKSITNATNPVSPVSPLNPASPTSSISAPITPSSPVTAPTQPTAQTSEQTQTGTQSEVRTDAPTTMASPTTSSTSTSKESPTPKARLVTPLGLALSLELFVKPGLTQPSLFPNLTLSQPIPVEMLIQDNVMALMFQPTINQYLEPQDLGFEQ